MKRKHALIVRRPMMGMLSLMTVLWLCISGQLTAQDTMRFREEYWIQVQDSAWKYRITPSGDTLDPDWFSAMYHYEMLYDSACVVTYNFTECKRNGVRLRLPQWKNRRIVNANAALLSFNSRTDNFAVRAGDTLSFYREFSWYNPRTYWTDADTYLAHDSVDFAVELVNARDSLRLDLLDSIGALPRAEPGVPLLHGTRPIFALVRYVIPSSIVADSAFIRVRLYARGNGAYDFSRHDQISIALSSRIGDAYWTWFTNRIGGNLGKHVVRMDEMGGAGDARLKVVRSSSLDHAVEIRFGATSTSEGMISVVIFDARGEAIFYPYNGAARDLPDPIIYRAPESGTYFVGLVRDGAVTTTGKFTIAK